MNNDSNNKSQVPNPEPHSSQGYRENNQYANSPLVIINRNNRTQYNSKEDQHNYPNTELSPLDIESKEHPIHSPDHRQPPKITSQSFAFLHPSTVQPLHPFPLPIPGMKREVLDNNLLHSSSPEVSSFHRISQSPQEREPEYLTSPSPQEMDEHSFTEYPPTPEHTLDHHNTTSQQQKFIIYNIYQTTTEEEE